ncbi:uncharacterized protein LOC122964874 [Acropora millepora]|uniref:uncharacterized protein LOC122964874 n=1 Tax=Acropora millepora TaxID=45264 RepID=UPI001CF0E2C4|nr:uncharacterized protein LOC122964874 [Acropora millepora]
MEGGKKRKLSEDYYDMPPKCRVKRLKLSDLPKSSKTWRNADLPIDILLLTVEDCEFLSCFSFLDRPFKSYNKEVGMVYFGYTGNTGDQEKLKVALMKCRKGALDPRGSLIAVKNAVRVLSPKAVFLVGTCSGLSSDKVKLGDVVISAELTTAAGFKIPVSRHVSYLVRDAPHGWVAPLENPDELEVEVHCDGSILSQTQKARRGWADLHLQYPEAIAVETEGEGVFAAAYDEKVEWVVVKGVARFVNETQLSRSEWMSFASTMAASVVAKMLNDPVVFQEWPHCNQGGKKRKLSEDYYDMPPKCRVKRSKRSEIPKSSKTWRNADLPIDILLLTVEDCEFLSCFSFLDRPFKSYKKEVGMVYFGYTGNTGDQEKLKVALMKCSKGAAVPGGSLTAVKNAVRVLSPKTVFSVGTCSGLSSDKVKLGDVVVSAKLTTAAGFKTPVSRHVSDLVRDAPYGWVAPVENPDELEVEVHCDGDILSQTQTARFGCADLHLQYPEAIAVETEGEGVFAAAYDEKVEWVVVKGVARFVNETQLSRSEWMSFASTMAASVVAKMLNDPVVFQEWPHCNQEMLTQRKRKEGDAKDNMGGIEAAESTEDKKLKKNATGTSNENLEQGNAQKTKEGQCEGEFQLQEFIWRLKDIVISSTGHVTDLQQPFRSNPGEGPPAKDFTVDEIFVNVVIREGRVSYNFPADRWEQLKVYPMASGEQTNALRPQDIFDSCHRNVLAVGRPGIGKTLLCTRLLRFWASGDTKIQSQCEVAFLLKFRHLNSETHLNLRELLTRAETLKCLEDGLWQYINDNPSKVLLIFDGLDEFSSTPGIARDDSSFNNTAEVRMPMGCLYKKIASGKLLQGCTLLTTVRPTAVEDVRELQFDRTVEITGFTFEQVEEFVEKFTKDDDSGNLKEIIWQHISTNINLFSLCYIPVNCFIICHCLLQLINIRPDAEHKLPVKITEIYSISVKIFFYKHSRGKYSCSKTDLGCYMYKRFDEPQPENDEVFKKLGKIAFDGIKSGKLVFESYEVSGLEDCGLLHRLPDMKSRKLTQPSRAQYCFTHLTVQEFFAAKHLTDTLPKDKLQRFVADHIRVGTWKVVMQFVAGLLEQDTRQRTRKSEIFTHLLPEKIERSDRSDLIWWPYSKEDKVLALDVCKCLYEFDGEQEKVKIQSKGAVIGFNAVDFSGMKVVPIDCPAVMDFVRDANVISLTINVNDVGPLGCKEMQYSLKDVNCKLTQLKLGNNEIGDQGAAH